MRDGPRTDRQTDRPSYRDARTHLKKPSPVVQMHCSNKDYELVSRSPEDITTCMQPLAFRNLDVFKIMLNHDSSHVSLLLSSTSPLSIYRGIFSIAVFQINYPCFFCPLKDRWDRFDEEINNKAVYTASVAPRKPKSGSITKA